VFNCPNELDLINYFPIKNFDVAVFSVALVQHLHLNGISELTIVHEPINGFHWILH
jgi:hypothetical protein